MIFCAQLIDLFHRLRGKISPRILVEQSAAGLALELELEIRKVQLGFSTGDFQGMQFPFLGRFFIAQPAAFFRDEHYFTWSDAVESSIDSSIATGRNFNERMSSESTKNRLDLICNHRIA